MKVNYKAIYFGTKNRVYANLEDLNPFFLLTTPFACSKRAIHVYHEKHWIESLFKAIELNHKAFRFLCLLQKYFFLFGFI